MQEEIKKMIVRFSPTALCMLDNDDPIKETDVVFYADAILIAKWAYVRGRIEALEIPELAQLAQTLDDNFVAKRKTVEGDDYVWLTGDN